MEAKTSKWLINLLVAILTAIGTAIGTSSCVNYL